MRINYRFFGGSRNPCMANMQFATNKLLIMHNILHTKPNTDILYQLREEGGSRLLNAEKTVGTGLLGVENYVVWNEEKEPSAVKNVQKVIKTVEEFKNGTEKADKKNWNWMSNS